MRRRSLLLAGLTVLCWPLAGGASPMQGLRVRGRGSFRRFGFHVYDATLWTGELADGPPLALRLDYRRKLSGQAIAVGIRRLQQALDLTTRGLLQPQAGRHHPRVVDHHKVAWPKHRRQIANMPVCQLTIGPTHRQQPRVAASLKRLLGDQLVG